jgi:KDO2-lipid IV(A) lauroyltransferase
MRASLKALRQGRGVGTLIDQNTRVRDGGVFVNFFGLPVPSSAAPAALKRYCDTHDLPAVIVYGTSLRLADGRNTAHSAYLPKPFAEYADDREVLQELMAISEKFIRMHPEQYLWLYKRFQYIPPDCPADLRGRYPDYAAEPKPSFFRKKSGETQRHPSQGGE